MYYGYLNAAQRQHANNFVLLEYFINFIKYDQECDLVMGAIGMTNTRLPVLDFSQGYYYTGIAFMIPMPGNSNNVAAVVKPFQLPVKS
jgi:hypothetical protein